MPICDCSLPPQFTTIPGRCHFWQPPFFFAKTVNFTDFKEYMNHQGILLKCRFWSRGRAWDSTFLTSLRNFKGLALSQKVPSPSPSWRSLQAWKFFLHLLPQCPTQAQDTVKATVWSFSTTGKKESNVPLKENFLRAGGCIIPEADENPGSPRPRKELRMQGGCCDTGVSWGEPPMWVHAQCAPLSYHKSL